MLNNREIKILDIFSLKEEVSIKELKESFNISERMVRYDIEKINFVLSIFNLKPIYRSKTGFFKLDKNNKINKVKLIIEETEPITIEKRKKLIELSLATSRKKINISTLMDKFDTSRITINNDLNNIKKEFLRKNIRIDNRKGLSLEGELSDLIKVRVEKISESLKYLKNKKNKTNYNLKIEEIFKENLNIKDINILSKFLQDVLNKLNFSATDENYKLLLSYIILLQSENYHEEIIKFIHIDASMIKDWEEYKIIKSQVENSKLGEIFNENDIFIITDLIVGMVSYNKTSQFYENWIDIDVLVKSLIENVNNKLDVDISEDKLLFQYLRQHLKPLFYRIKNDYSLNEKFVQDLKFSKNSLFYLIKDSLEILSNILKKDIPDEEIFLLMLHFQASMERAENNVSNIKRIIIVSTLGYGISQILADSISSLFNVEIVSVGPYFKIKEMLQKNKNIDYIITTIDIDNKASLFIPVIKVNPIFTFEDKKKMLELGFLPNNKKILMSEILQIIGEESTILNKKKLIKKLENKMKGKIINDISDENKVENMISKDNIIFDYKAENIEKAIKYTCELLEREGSIEKSYTENVIDIFKNHSSYLLIHNGIILPHARNTGNVFKTSGILLALQNPVMFNETEVKYIFTFAIKDKNSELNKVSKIINQVFKDDLIKILSTKNVEKTFRYFLGGVRENI